MLSSLLQQRGDIPDISFSVGYPENNGDPTTEEVVAFFRKQGLQIKTIPYPDMEVIQFRGLVRNEQLWQSDADWLLFSDTDMTYSPDFFADLAQQLNGELEDEELILSASRVSLHKDFCKDFFNKWDGNKYPCVVENAGELQDWPIFQIGRSCGAGYFQLVNRECVIDNFGWYVNPDECKDRTWEKGQKARSDIQFRNMVGGIRKIETKPQYHLNHERDNEVGHHLTIQR
tara:strand:+ start:239 stop:928 length:690 start_codon:yes stop_codon:yes gene_type:complete